MIGRIEKFIEPRDYYQAEDGSMQECIPQAFVDVRLFQDGEEVGEIEFRLEQFTWGMT